jgi:hypothetical protein
MQSVLDEQREGPAHPALPPALATASAEPDSLPGTCWASSGICLSFATEENMSLERNRAIGRTLAYGLVSLSLYTLLYLFNEQILALSKEGRWNFIVPMVIAFIFSIVHGNFTGQFWDMFGIKPKTTKK